MQMNTERVDQIIATHGGEASALIQVLLDIQKENHWLPKEALERVSERLGVSLAKIRHIASFYTAFSLVPMDGIMSTCASGRPATCAGPRASSTPWKT